VGFRTSAATSKAPRTDGKVYIVKDVDQASISIAVGDTTVKLGAGPSSEQGFRVRNGRIAVPGAANRLTGLHFPYRSNSARMRIRSRRNPDSSRKGFKISKSPTDWMPPAKAFWPPM
jgi:hypothetical protein